MESFLLSSTGKMGCTKLAPAPDINFPQTIYAMAKPSRYLAAQAEQIQKLS